MPDRWAELVESESGCEDFGPPLRRGRGRPRKIATPQQSLVPAAAPVRIARQGLALLANLRDVGGRAYSTLARVMQLPGLARRHERIDKVVGIRPCAGTLSWYALWLPRKIIDNLERG